MAAKRVANTKWPPSPTQVRPGETAGKPDLGGLYEENQRLRREKAQARKEAAARASELEARSEIAQRRNSFFARRRRVFEGVLEGRSPTEPPSTPPPQHCPSCKERLPCACTEPCPRASKLAYSAWAWTQSSTRRCALWSPTRTPPSHWMVWSWRRRRILHPSWRRG